MKYELTQAPGNRTIERLFVLFIGLFAVSLVAVAVYQLVCVLPAKHCEAHGWWWDGETRQCGMPVSITSLTHRPIGSPKVTPPAKAGALSKS